jgi:hypothetical protein
MSFPRDGGRLKHGSHRILGLTDLVQSVPAPFASSALASNAGVARGSFLFDALEEGRYVRLERLAHGGQVEGVGEVGASRAGQAVQAAAA